MSKSHLQISHDQLSEIARRWLLRPESGKGPGCGVAFKEVGALWDRERADAWGYRWSHVSAAVCALIVLTITWNDEPGFLEKLLASLLKWGIAGFGVVFFLWGAGVKLGLWSSSITGEPGKLTSVSDSMLPASAILLGPLVLIVIFINLRSRWL